MSSGSELDEELLQVAGQARKKGTSSTAKRKRAQHFASDSSEEVSLDEESDWEAEEMAARYVPCDLNLCDHTCLLIYALCRIHMQN